MPASLPWVWSILCLSSSSPVPTSGLTLSRSPSCHPHRPTLHPCLAVPGRAYSPSLLTRACMYTLSLCMVACTRRPHPARHPSWVRPTTSYNDRYPPSLVPALIPLSLAYILLYVRERDACLHARSMPITSVLPPRGGLCAGRGVSELAMKFFCHKYSYTTTCEQDPLRTLTNFPLLVHLHPKTQTPQSSLTFFRPSIRSPALMNPLHAVIGREQIWHWRISPSLLHNLPFG